MKMRVTTQCRVAMPGNPSEPQVMFRKGVHDIDKFPRWAVEKMARLGYAEPVDVEMTQAEVDEMDAKIAAEEAEKIKAAEEAKAAEAAEQVKAAEAAKAKAASEKEKEHAKGAPTASGTGTVDNSKAGGKK